MVVEKTRVMKLYKKQCLPVITKNKKHSQMNVAPITCTLEVFFRILLKIIELFLFRH